MKQKQLSALISAALMTVATMAGATPPSGTPQTTAFTYQGQLNAGGTFPTGTYEFTFTLYDAQTGGSQVGAAIPESVQVIDGLFTADLDFGTPFAGQQYCQSEGLV